MEEQSRTYILEASDLSVSFETDAGEVQAVRDVSLSLKEGEVLAIVGESGCGKSVLCKSLMKMLPENARIKSGKILANGIDITGYKERDMAKLRGTFFSMVFQDPMTALNPTMTIGRQIEEAIKIHNPHIKRDALEKRVMDLRNSAIKAEISNGVPTKTVADKYGVSSARVSQLAPRPKHH